MPEMPSSEPVNDEQPERPALPKPVPTKQDHENARIRQEIAEKQEAEYVE